MARTKRMWTPLEEEALIAGVKRYGIGKWKEILNDPDFAEILCRRSNVDLKDKWRNLNMHAPIDVAPGEEADSGIDARRTVRATRNKLRLVIIIITVIALLIASLVFAIDMFRTLPIMLKCLWLQMCYLIPIELLKMCKSFIKFLRKLRRFYKWIKNVTEHVPVHGII